MPNQLEAIADFIASDEGAMYGAYCEAYGEHPGAIFSDDVLRFQVGLAYMLRDKFAEPAEPDYKGGYKEEDFYQG